MSRWVDNIAIFSNMDRYNDNLVFYKADWRVLLFIFCVVVIILYVCMNPSILSKLSTKPEANTPAVATFHTPVYTHVMQNVYTPAYSIA